MSVCLACVMKSGDRECTCCFILSFKICWKCVSGKGLENCTEMKCSSRTFSPTISQVLQREFPKTNHILYEELFFILNIWKLSWVEALEVVDFLGPNIMYLDSLHRSILTIIAFKIKFEQQAKMLLKNWKKFYYPIPATSLFYILKRDNPIATFHRCLKLFGNAQDNEGNNLFHYISADKKLARNERLHFTKILLAQSKK